MSTAPYVRLSQNRGHDEDKPDRQREQIAPLLGPNPLPEYLDDDFSAFRGKKRPAWEQLLDDIRAGRATRVVAAHIDRVLRNMKELEGLIDLSEKHPFVIDTAASGCLDLSTFAGRMQARMLVTFSAGESERKAERHQSKAAQLRAQGKSTGGARPFGWVSPNGALEPTEARMIFDAIHDVIEKRPLAAIRREWVASGVESSFGAVKARRVAAGRPARESWADNKAVGRILTRYRNAGLVEHNGQVVGRAVWPAIWPGVPFLPITADDIAAVRVALSPDAPLPDVVLPNGKVRKSKPGQVRRSTPGPSRRHLLSGILTCVKCGHTLRKYKGGRQTDYYGCSRPGCYLAIQVEAADMYVTGQIVGVFCRTDPAEFAPHPSDRKQLVSLRTDRGRIVSESVELGKRVGKGEVPLNAATEVFQGYSERMAEIDRNLDLISTRIATAVMLSEPVGKDEFAPFERVAAIRSNFTGLSLDKKRAIIQQVFSSVLVHPGRGSAEQRVCITRRDGKPLTKSFEPIYANRV